MNELSILCFLSIAHTHNFSITARELLLTQQAVSRYVQKLEEELGTVLFLRSHNKVQLTSNGFLLYQYLTDMNEKYLELERRLDSLRQDKTLRVGLSPWIGNAPFISRAIQAISEENILKILVCEISYQELKEFSENKTIDCFIGTEYELSMLSAPHTDIALFESPIGILSCPGKPPHPHLFATMAGENSELQARASLLKLCRASQVPTEKITLLPNYDSVWMNVFMEKGSSFALQASLVARDQRYSFQETEQSAGLCTGVFTPGRSADLQILTDSIRKEYQP